MWERLSQRKFNRTKRNKKSLYVQENKVAYTSHRYISQTCIIITLSL